MIKIGDLKNIITIQRKASCKDKDGYKKEVWEDYCRCYCAINNLYGQELYQAMAVKQENILNFTVRYNKKLEFLNTKDFRIIWGKKLVNIKEYVNGAEVLKSKEVDRDFNIILVDYLKFNKRFITIKALEVM